MKLLICTQKVDINDDILGFFHGWILGFPIADFRFSIYL